MFRRKQKKQSEIEKLEERITNLARRVEENNHEISDLQVENKRLAGIVDRLVTIDGPRTTKIVVDEQGDGPRLVQVREVAVRDA